MQNRIRSVLAILIFFFIVLGLCLGLSESGLSKEKRLAKGKILKAVCEQVNEADGRIATSMINSFWAIGKGTDLDKNGYSVSYETSVFTDSTKLLYNPYQGFFTLKGFRISPGMKMPKVNAQGYSSRLMMIQFNISDYKDGDIDENGIRIMNAILDELDAAGKSVVIRFLYDWNGKAKEVEPSDISVVVKHINQVAPVINSHKDMILLHQGIFIGDCAEMHGSKFGGDDNATMLYLTIENAFEDIPLGVRTPRYHRLFSEAGADVSRIAFFNDGMFGSVSDLGSYVVKGLDRASEMAYQDKYCRYVPNGGEAVFDNEYSDLTRVVPELYQMHVSYLNKDHDTKTIKKWKNSVYTGNDIWNGKTGYTYIEQHMGYRYQIKDFKAESSTAKSDVFDPKSEKKESLTLSVNLYNEGFASTMKPFIPYVVLESENGNKMCFPMQGNLMGLHSSESMDITVDINWDELEELDPLNSKITVSFYIKDKRNGEEIGIGTDCRMDTDGHYIVGSFECSEL